MPPKDSGKKQKKKSAVTADYCASTSTQNPSEEDRQVHIKWKGCISKTYLLEWLQEPRNFEKWKFSGKQGIDGLQTSAKTKKDILTEIVACLVEKGITFRNETTVKNKIAACEAKWKLAHDSLQSTGAGCENDAEKLAVDDIKGKVDKICSDWDVLNRIFSQRPGMAPKYVGESGDGATLGIDTAEESPGPAVEDENNDGRESSPVPPRSPSPVNGTPALVASAKRQKTCAEKPLKGDQDGKVLDEKTGNDDKTRKKIADTLQRLQAEATARNADRDRRRERKLDIWEKKNDQQFQVQQQQFQLQERKEARKEEELRVRKMEAENIMFLRQNAAGPRAEKREYF